MSKISEEQLQSFQTELEKLGSKWYANVGKTLSNFGKRQLHGVTGWTPKGYMNAKGIEEIGAGAASARKELKAAKGAVDKGRAREALDAELKAQEMGLTSLPGYAKSLVKDPGGTLRAGWNQQWHGASPTMKAIQIGLPAAATVGDLVSEDDGHKGERIGSGIANTAVGMVTGGLPMAGGVVAGLGAGLVGGRIGRIADKMREHKKKVPPMGTLAEKVNPEEARGQHVPIERISTPTALGQVPEVFG